jgi:microcystin-dependent protein
MTFYKWSRTAADNGSADSTAPFPEGMAPSAVNDGVRGAMAALAKFRDDLSGQIVTAGTSTVYTVSSFQDFDSLADMDGKEIWFTPHVTNGNGPVYMTIDGLGQVPLRFSPGVDLPSGTIIQGTPYGALYNKTAGELYLKGAFLNPYNIPLAAAMDYWGTTAPNSCFAFPVGQAISRTTYATLFALLGTTYGGGDGSTTFNLPDVRGRVIAGADDMGGSSAGRLGTASGMNGSGIGAVGGSQTKALATANLPPYTPSGSVGATLTSIAAATRSSSASGANDFSSLSLGNTGGSGTGNVGTWLAGATISAGFTGTPQGGTSSPVAIVQPTIIANKILRII